MGDEENLIIDLTTEPNSLPTDAPCPICGISLPIEELTEHANAHFAAEHDDVAADQLHHQSPLLSEDPAAVACPLCGQMLYPDEIDSHELAHAIKLEDLDPHAIADDLYYEELRSAYGFTAPRRPKGKCFICGQEGHWVPECPLNPDNIAGQARIIPEPTAAAVAAAQISDPQFQRPPINPAAMLRLLGAACTKQNLPKEFSRCTTLLCGTVSHFGGQKIDSGWGCGYRNIQMMASYLLATDPLSAHVLFSGCRFVPDIPSLQAWIEVAWRQGFDSVGADQLEKQLQGGKKWIGTTEAATLFRYFGIPAVIVDFGTKRSATDGVFNMNSVGGACVSSVNNINQQQQQQSSPQGRQMKITAFTTTTTTTAACTLPKDSAPTAPEDEDVEEEVHGNVECDVCGTFPLRAERFKSQVLPDYDVCGHCLQTNPTIITSAGPFSRVPASIVRDYGQISKRVKANACGKTVAGQGRPNSSDSGGRKECSAAGKSLLNWVWDYFSRVDCVFTESEAEGATHGYVGGAAATGGGNTKGERSSPPPPPDHRQQQQHYPRPHSPPLLPLPSLRLSRDGPGFKVQTQYTGLSPLYLQHEGHSRTIIGVEKKERRDGTSEITLLMLDPGVPPPALHDALAAGIKWQRLIKRSAETLNKMQYQIMYCPNGAAPATPGSGHYDALKILSAQETY